MILYHGTNNDFLTIDLNLTKPFKDFGKGFYLTDIQSQAYDLAKKRSMFLGGEPIVQKYQFDKKILYTNELKILKFEKPNKDWAEFIFKNRNKNQNFVHTYDIVQGPIADDGVAYLLNLYEDGLRTLEELAKELEFRKLNNQYCFLTKKSISYLKRVYDGFNAK